MTKKSKYKIPPQNQLHNRVDIFRSVQPIHIVNLNEPYTISNGAYVNTGFASSSDNINNNNNNINTTVLDRSYTNSPAPTKNAKKTKISSSKYTILKIFVIVFILLALLAIVLSLALTLSKSNNYIVDNLCPACQQNSYCIQNPEKKPICVCRPGYMFNNSKCIQSFCYTGYVPYSNITENTTYGISLLNNSIKPFCCPDNKYSTNCCGVPINDIIGKNKRIIGGLPSRLGNWPWIVDVIQVYRTNTRENITIINNCSGALISDRYVLTAAHCLVDDEVQFNNEFKNQESMFRVHFGFANKSSIYKPGVLNLFERNVSRIIIHEAFEPAFLKNDIAILKLDFPIQRDVNVDFICLFNYELEDLIVKNEKLYVAGWGSTSMDMNYPVYSDTLQYVDLDPLPMEDCYYINQDPSIYNTTKQVCAGFKVLSNINKDTCNGDSGSPLMVRLNGQWFHYGIVSFGSQVDCGRGPAIYTRTAYFYDWILKKINE
jgi:hypothetical protein